MDNSLRTCRVISLLIYVNLEIIFTINDQSKTIVLLSHKGKVVYNRPPNPRWEPWSDQRDDIRDIKC